MAKVEVKELGEVRGTGVVRRVPNRLALAADIRPGSILVFHGREGSEYVVEVFTPDQSGDRALPPGPHAVTRFTGPLDKVDNAYASILFWALGQGRSTGTPTREVYSKVDRGQDPPEVEVEIQVPIR